MNEYNRSHESIISSFCVILNYMFYICILQLTLSSTVCHSRTEELLSVESLPSQWLMLVNVGKRPNSMHLAFFIENLVSQYNGCKWGCLIAYKLRMNFWFLLNQNDFSLAGGKYHSQCQYFTLPFT